MSTEQPSIFTRIINREIPADIVYEDTSVIAFLTIEPINPGHTLIVPKIPFTNIFDADESTMGHIMAIAKKISNAIVTTGLGDGVNLIMNNGTAAGQEVFHAHLHVVPRNEQDNSFAKPSRVSYANGESTIVANTIASSLD